MFRCVVRTLTGALAVGACLGASGDWSSGKQITDDGNLMRYQLDLQGGAKLYAIVSADGGVQAVHLVPRSELGNSHWLYYTQLACRWDRSVATWGNVVIGDRMAISIPSTAWAEDEDDDGPANALDAQLLAVRSSNELLALFSADPAARSAFLPTQQMLDEETGPLRIGGRRGRQRGGGQRDAARPSRRKQPGRRHYAGSRDAAQQSLDACAVGVDGIRRDHGSRRHCHRDGDVRTGTERRSDECGRNPPRTRRTWHPPAPGRRVHPGLQSRFGGTSIRAARSTACATPTARTTATCRCSTSAWTAVRERSSSPRSSPCRTMPLGDPPGLLDEDGSAVVIHANPDDHLTQPIGGAGGRVGCGVISATEAMAPEV